MVFRLGTTWAGEVAIVSDQPWQDANCPFRLVANLWRSFPKTYSYVGCFNGYENCVVIPKE